MRRGAIMPTTAQQLCELTARAFVHGRMAPTSAWPSVDALARRWLADFSATYDVAEPLQEYYDAVLDDAKPPTLGCERAVLNDAEGRDDSSRCSPLEALVHSGWEVWGSDITPAEEHWLRQYTWRRQPFTLTNRSAECADRDEHGRPTGEHHPSSVWRYGYRYPSLAHAICFARISGVVLTLDALQQAGTREEVEAQMRLALDNPDSLLGAATLAALALSYS